MSEDSQHADQSRVADAVFEAVADEQRRLALYYLDDRESATVEELATVVSGWRRAREDDREMVTPDDRERSELRLHHVHLPKLAETGFVSYDREDGEVALDDAPELLESILDQSLARERPAVGPESLPDADGLQDDGRRPDDESRAGGG